MVEKQRSLGESARAIRASLVALLTNGDAGRINVEANDWGRLDVVIGAERYRGMGIVDRVNRVFDHLKKTLDPADLANVGKVWVLDRDEYERTVEFGESLGEIPRGQGTSNE